MFANVEPPHSYVRDASDPVAHHSDYLNNHGDQALCGLSFENPTALNKPERPAEVCPDCEAKLVEYHLKWWRDRALAVTAELDELRIKYRELTKNEDAVPRQPSVKAPTHISAAAEGADKPGSLLDHARRQLLEVCRQFDTAVPYRHVKTTMQAFSDQLSPDDRVLLAQQIGNDGSLIRWSTKEVESLGWSVAGNPVQAEPEELWDAWTRDSFHAPKPNRWRLGRSRSTGG